MQVNWVVPGFFVAAAAFLIAASAEHTTWVRAGAALARTTEIPRCQTDLADALSELKAPGLAIAIATPEGVACASAAGYADIAARRPATIDTLFLTASVSKTVTAVAAMQLFEEGRYALDDDVSTHLPFAVRAPSEPNQTVTFRHLMTHTAALRDNWTVLKALVTQGGDSPLSLAAFTRAYLTPSGEYYNRRRNFARRAPGEQYEYANMGVVLLGYLVERLSREPFDVSTRRRILEPLGMRTSGWRLARLDQEKLATPYKMTVFGPKAFAQYGQPNYPDGMLRSSARELGRFLAAIAGRGRLVDTRILAPTTVDLMLTPQTIAEPSQGLVWFQDTLNGRKVWGHDGSDDGASAWIWLDRRTARGVLILANAEADDDAAESLAASLLDEAARLK